MRRLLTFACLSTALLLAGCSGKKPGGLSSGPDEVTGPDGTPRKDGGSKPSRGGGGGDDDDGDDDDGDDDVKPGKSDGGYVATPTSTDFIKDATGGSGLGPKVIEELKEGGKNCSAKVLYPYADTIFPAGLTPPTIMWEGASEAAYVKIVYDRVSTLDYEFAAGASTKGELKIPPNDWTEITRRSQGTPMMVTLTTKSGSNLSTCKLRLRVAQGAMTGAIYYNTYNTPSKGGMGAIMRLTLGNAESEIYLSYPGVALPSTGPCISCHSVSFNGSMIAASTHNYTPVVGSFETGSYAISSQPEPMRTSPLPESTFGAFTPDGTKMLSLGNPDCTAGADSFPRSPNNFPLVAGPAKAALHDTRTGQAIPAQGLKPEWFMWMPQFSPKGDKVVFNHAKLVDGKTDRRELAMMDFDASTNTFSNLRVLVSKQGPAPSLDYAPGPASLPILTGAGGCTTPVTQPQGAIPGGSCTGPCYPAWPFFTPNGEGVVYSLISEPDFMLGFPGRDKASQSELWYVDVASGKSVKLDNANKGLAPGDSLANYSPTVLPVQVGGYYWIFWTSTRAWGHRDFTVGIEQLVSNPFGGTASLEALKKRIWVSALRAPQGNVEGGESTEVRDISAPAFYLEGQSNTGNVRAFAALNPCRASGKECTSGLDCCTGYCKIEKGAEAGKCTEEPPPCAKLNERCAADKDCCAPESSNDETLSCIGNFCGFDAPPQ